MQHETHRVPVTALAFLDRDVILSGEGPLLKAYRLPSKTLLTTTSVFPSQAIHGVIITHRGDSTFALIWGGQCIRAVKLCNDGSEVQIILGEIREGDDWILDAAISEASSEESSWSAALVTAHNALSIATVGDNLSLDLRPVVSGSNCILYCAQVTWLSASKCLIASGTAFGDVVVWTCSLPEDQSPNSAVTQTHYTFSAHEGSVFGVRIASTGSGNTHEESTRLLASCSDDRTIRVWDISDLDVESPTLAEEQRQTGFGSKTSEDSHAPKLLSKVMGHLSRIWHVMFLPKAANSPKIKTNALPPLQTSLMSFGEDATCITWDLRPAQNSDSSPSYTLEQQYSQRAHTGKNIWSVAFDGLDQIATGAADGAIAVRSLTQCCDGISISQLRESLLDIGGQADTIRSYGFIGPSWLLATTDKGRVTLIDLQKPQEPHLIQLCSAIGGLRGYSIVASSSGVAFAAGSDGVVYAYSSASEKPYAVLETGRKIAGLFDQASEDGNGETSLLITNMGTARAFLCILAEKDRGAGPALQTKRDLKLPQDFIVTSFIHMQRQNYNLVVLGSRQGCIAVFDLHKSDTEAMVSATIFATGIHGKETVTCLRNAYDSNGIRIFSTGRDGTYAAHELVVRGEELAFTTLHQLTLPFGPNIEHLDRSPEGHLWIWGFRGKQFVVYDIDVQQEVMAVECGGAHRNWSFQIGEGGGTFVWTKASKLYYSTQARLPFQTIHSGGHGREIKAVAVSPADPSLIATGAEDTDIKLSKYEENGTFRPLHTLQKHNTGIQEMAWSDDGKYLFSSGGFEEFYVWKIRRDVPSTLSIGVTCESGHPRSGSSDLRIMNFDVQQMKGKQKGETTSDFRITMVYSDSTIRTWQYQHRPLQSQCDDWLLLTEGNYLTSCLTQCLQTDQALLTAGTDGYLTRWNPEDPKTLTWHQRHRIHSSSILSLVRTHALPDGSRFVFTGGDDNAVGITRVSGSADSEVMAWSLLIPKAHAAAVTALAVFEEQSKHGTATYTLVSSSIDQRIKVWQINVSLVKHGIEGVDVQLVQNSFTAVADMSSMEKIQCVDESRKVLLCGVGMDVWKID